LPASGLKSACDRTDLPTARRTAPGSEASRLARQHLGRLGDEFGRLPIAQLPPNKNEADGGRDHNKNALSGWIAGVDIKGGTTHDATDDIGLAAVEDMVSVPDWHATILHLLELHQDELFVEHNGLKEKLTSVFMARVVKLILA